MNYILFALGALTMVIEFTVPRLIAPAYGYTMLGWTAIISVVLVAMTVGYFWGGKLTEQGEKTLARIILFGYISSGWTILIALSGISVVNSLSFLGVLIGPLVTSLLFAALPTFLNTAVQICPALPVKTISCRLSRFKVPVFVVYYIIALTIFSYYPFSLFFQE